MLLKECGMIWAEGIDSRKQDIDGDAHHAHG